MYRFWSLQWPQIENVTENWRYFRFSPNLDSGMTSSLANYSSFRHIPPSGEFLEFGMQATVMAVAVGEMFICSKLGQYLSEMEIRTFVRTQKVIWDQLLASKGGAALL